MDARLLLKASKSNAKRIEHPHIKYNSYGKISCIVCGIPIKSEITWKAHILSRSHKENAARGTDSLKRMHMQVKNSGPPAKQAKVESSDNTGKVSEPGESKETEFKVPVPLGKPPSPEKEEQKTSVLPEGFFDDARKDAEVRHVPYRDKLDAEMEAFQKELGALNQQSEEISERDNEEMVAARNLAELDKQISMWEKIHELEIKKETSLSKKVIKEPESEKGESADSGSDEDSSDIDEDELNNFRIKSAPR